MNRETLILITLIIPAGYVVAVVGVACVDAFKFTRKMLKNL